ncbi:MAG: hypothetical protein WA435_09540 [Gallionellaceae bacterium]
MHKNPYKQANLLKMPSRTFEREVELTRIEREAFANYRGTFDDFELALGVLRSGDYLGWRPLVLIHNKRTIRKIEEILNINVREFFPPEGVGAERSLGYSIAKKLGKFWKVVSGDYPVDNRREIGDTTQ